MNYNYLLQLFQNYLLPIYLLTNFYFKINNYNYFSEKILLTNKIYPIFN